jgi:hypothetical protein
MNSLPDFTSSKTPEEFQEFGYTYIHNIIDKQTCDSFAKEMLYLKQTDMLTKEKLCNLAIDNPTIEEINNFHSPYARGNINNFELFLKKITEPLSKKLNIEWESCHTYCRIYYNGGMLGKHIDRPGLDYALSITLENKLTKKWPLYVIDKKGNEIQTYTEVGDGILLLGRELEHWREPLVCGPDEYIIQLFLHWKKPESSA